MYIAAALVMATLGVRTPECAAGQGLLPREVVETLRLVSAACGTTQGEDSGASCRLRASHALEVLQRHTGSVSHRGHTRRKEEQSSGETTPERVGRDIDTLLEAQSRNANVLTESNPLTTPLTIDITTATNPGLSADLMAALMANKTADIERAIAELQASGDFEDTKSVLLMQQLMNEWSFTVGLSSALTKTISDALKGIVQKISRGASVLQATSIDDRVAQLAAFAAEESALQAAAADHAAALGSVIGDKAAQARVAGQLPEWAAAVQRGGAVAAASHVAGQSALDILMAEGTQNMPQLTGINNLNTTAVDVLLQVHAQTDSEAALQDALRRVTATEEPSTATLLELQFQLQMWTLQQDLVAKVAGTFDKSVDTLLKAQSRNANVLSDPTRPFPVPSSPPRFGFALLPTACVDVPAELRRILRALHGLL